MSSYKYTQSEAPIGRRLYVLATGEWRVMRPVIDNSACRGCGLCAMYCPTCSIAGSDERRFTVDYSYCKGCGICARECPVDAIAMKPEEEYDGEC